MSSGLNETRNFEECRKLSPVSWALLKDGSSFYIKNVFYTLSVLYGEVDTSYLTKDYVKLRLPSSSISLSYAVQWLVNTVLTTVVVMNLLVALTIGDVTEISKTADCHIVQIKLKKMFVMLAQRNFVHCFFKRRLGVKNDGAGNDITKKCEKPRDVSSNDRIADTMINEQRRSDDKMESESANQKVILYPNKFTKGCFVDEKESFMARLNLWYTEQYVLGCTKIRESLLDLLG